MMRERAIFLVAVVILLAAGYAFARVRAPAGECPEATIDPFRLWFWERRGLDLAVQIGLVFAGALGIAALLPGPDEEPGT